MWRKDEREKVTINYRTLGEVIFNFESADWMDEGKCRDLKTDIFYAEKGRQSVNMAKAICSGCPVREKCLDYAIRNFETHGIWGGHTASERRELRREWEETVLSGIDK